MGRRCNAFAVASLQPSFAPCHINSYLLGSVDHISHIVLDTGPHKVLGEAGAVLAVLGSVRGNESLSEDNGELVGIIRTFDKSLGVRENLTDALGLHHDDHGRVTGPESEDLSVLAAHTRQELHDHGSVGVVELANLMSEG